MAIIESIFINCRYYQDYSHHHYHNEGPYHNPQQLDELWYFILDLCTVVQTRAILD